MDRLVCKNVYLTSKRIWLRCAFHRIRIFEELLSSKLFLESVPYNLLGRCLLCGHFLDAGACFASNKTRLRITGEVCVYNDSCLDVKVIIWNDFIYRYTFLELICIHRKMPAARALPRCWRTGEVCV